MYETTGWSESSQFASSSTSSFITSCQSSFLRWCVGCMVHRNWSIDLCSPVLHFSTWQTFDDWGVKPRGFTEVFWFNWCCPFLCSYNHASCITVVKFGGFWICTSMEIDSCKALTKITSCALVRGLVWASNWLKRCWFSSTDPVYRSLDKSPTLSSWMVGPKRSRHCDWNSYQDSVGRSRRSLKSFSLSWAIWWVKNGHPVWAMIVGVPGH